MSALPVFLFVMSGVMKVMQTAQVVDGFTKMGIRNLAVPIGMVELTCTAIYLIPRTAVLGAILLTGYLGGAIASHLRIGSPLFSHILFGLYLGLMMWGGLWLRDRSLRNLIPLQR